MAARRGPRPAPRCRHRRHNRPSCAAEGRPRLRGLYGPRAPTPRRSFGPAVSGRPGQPSIGLQAVAGGAGKDGGSSTPRTTTTPSRIWRPNWSNFGLPACTTANGCFKKGNQTGGKATRPETRLERGDRDGHRHGVAGSARAATSCMVEATSASSSPRHCVKEAVKLGRRRCHNSYGAARSAAETKL